MLMLLGNDSPSYSRVFSVCLLVVGSVLVATIFGNMTVLLSNYDAQSRAYQEKLERVKQGLARMEVPALLQGRVIKYYEYMWRRQKSGANESNFVLELPRALRVDVQLHLHRQLVEKVPFFQGSERAFIQDIVEALASSIYGPGDNIIIEGDRGLSMFFVEAGEVQVVKEFPDGPRVIAALGAGDFFGEMALLDSSERRGAGIVATTFCDVQVLSKKSFDTIMADWPEYMPRIQAVAIKRAAANQKNKSDPAGEPAKKAEFAVARKKGGNRFKAAAKGVLATNRFASLLGGLSKPTSPSDAPPAGQPGPRKPSEAEPLIAAADAVTKLPGLPALAEIEECEEELDEEEEIGGLREKAGGGGGLGVSWGKAGGAGGAADGGGGGLPVVEKLQGVDGRLLKVESAVNGLRGQLQGVQDLLEKQSEMLAKLLEQQSVQ